MPVDRLPPESRATLTDVITDEAISKRVAIWFPNLADRRRYRCHTDATDFYQVDSGDVLIPGGHPYLILNNAKEGRFGLDDQEKFWVKRSVDLVAGHPHFMKGFATSDSRGNIIRVLDFINGKFVYDTIEKMAGGHRTYFFMTSR